MSKNNNNTEVKEVYLGPLHPGLFLYDSCTNTKRGGSAVQAILGLHRTDALYSRPREALDNHPFVDAIMW